MFFTAHGIRQADLSLINEVKYTGKIIPIISESAARYVKKLI